MSLKKTFAVTRAFISAQGATRCQLFVRGTLFILLPVLVPVVLAIVQHAVSMFHPGATPIPNGPEPRPSEVFDDWTMLACSALGIFCECLGLSFIGKLEKRFSLIFVSAFLVGVFSLLFSAVLFVIGVAGAVDLISPGARFYS